jgi:hypothetical protein
VTADQDVLNESNGTDANGNALQYALAAMFFDGHLFGRSVDYAEPEGGNVSASRWDQVTSLAKLLTRTAPLSDKNDYDLWDMVRTCTKFVLAQDPTINDDESLSVNYKGTTPVVESATFKAIRLHGL